MTARKPTSARKPAAATQPAVEQPLPGDDQNPTIHDVRVALAEEAAASASAEQEAQADAAPAPELAWCRIGRDLEENAPECPRHEFEAGARLCNLHFVTRLDLREVARNDD